MRLGSAKNNGNSIKLSLPDQLSKPTCVKLAEVMQDTNRPPKRRTPPWILGGVVLILLTFLILLQTSTIWKNFTVESASDTLSLYALLSLNFIAFVIFAFILIRSLLKLQRERRALQLGSKLKSKLLFYFVAVNVLPIIAMAFYSYLYMNRAFDRWSTEIPNNTIQAAQNVQNQAIANQIIKLQETGRIIVGLLNKQEINNEKLAKIVEEGNLTYLSVVSKEGRILAKSERELAPEQKTELNKIIELINQNKLNEPVLQDGVGFDAAKADFADGRELVIVPDLKSEENVSQLIKDSSADFEKLKQDQYTVRQIGLSTLGLITFLLIFASSWTALYVARGLTVPIKALAEGADEIAHGNFSHRVEVLAEDELALLVTTFNQMSAILEANSNELSERRKYIETVLQSL
jgi:two-component system nitrogen regulation sensor histidine kinase NtrY